MTRRHLFALFAAVCVWRKPRQRTVVGLLTVRADDWRFPPDGDDIFFNRRGPLTVHPNLPPIVDKYQTH